MCNSDIRNSIKEANLKHWQVADLLNISEATMVRKLRRELSKEEKAKIFNIISKIKKERKG